MLFTRRMFLESAGVAGLLSLTGARPRGEGAGSRGAESLPRPRSPGKPWPVTFTEIGLSSGLTSSTIYGEEYIKRYIVEAIGPGIAFFDYDHDGWLDIFVPSGTRVEGFPPGQAPSNRLYHNNRDGTFTDITAKAELTNTGWCYGICVGGYDNDGRDDLFLTYYGENVLYHNNGDGTFTHATEKAGLQEPRDRWGTGCTFVDYDRDGNLDTPGPEVQGVSLWPLRGMRNDHCHLGRGLRWPSDSSSRLAPERRASVTTERALAWLRQHAR